MPPWAHSLKALLSSSLDFPTSFPSSLEADLDMEPERERLDMELVRVKSGMLRKWSCAQESKIAVFGSTSTQRVIVLEMSYK